jgi:hypothetical protein
VTCQALRKSGRRPGRASASRTKRRASAERTGPHSGHHVTPPRPWESPGPPRPTSAAAARPDAHSQWHAAPPLSDPRRALAPANLRPPGGLRRVIGCYTCPSILFPSHHHRLRSAPLCPAPLPSPPRPRHQRRGGLILDWDARLTEASPPSTGPGPEAARGYLSQAQLHPNEAPTPHSGAPNSSAPPQRVASARGPAPGQARPSRCGRHRVAPPHPSVHCASAEAAPAASGLALRFGSTRGPSALPRCLVFTKVYGV